jgi:plasmid stability protein
MAHRLAGAASGHGGASEGREVLTSVVSATEQHRCYVKAAVSDVLQEGHG